MMEDTQDKQNLADNKKEDMDHVFDSFRTEFRLTREYKLKKIILWLIRNTILAVVYFILWKYTWVKWTLVVTVPLSLISLVSILGWNFFLDKRVQKARDKFN